MPLPARTHLRSTSLESENRTYDEACNEANPALALPKLRRTTIVGRDQLENRMKEFEFRMSRIEVDCGRVGQEFGNDFLEDDMIAECDEA